MEVTIGFILLFPKDLANEAFFIQYRPKEHHAFDVLHWIKVAFKKHALDQFEESDCFNKEAFR